MAQGSLMDIDVHDNEESHFRIPIVGDRALVEPIFLSIGLVLLRPS